MGQPVSDRRADVRVTSRRAGITRATLRPGCSVDVIDVSAGGALVEAGRPMRPGAVVHVQLVTALRAVALAGRVLRCAVWSLDAGIIYRGAVQFDNPCHALREPETPPGSDAPGLPDSGGPASGYGEPASGARSALDGGAIPK